MASSVGFSIASPSGAIGGVSPVKAPKPTIIRKGPTASELLEQIRNLESEGNKLRAAAVSGFGTGAIDVSGLSDKSELPKLSLTSASSLSALMDISQEQKTISDLRLQLEQQRQETERLNSHLLGDGFTSSTSRAGTVLHIPNSPSKTGFSTLPSTELFSARRAPGTPGATEISPPSHLEKALKDSQEQVADLRRRLTDSNDMNESQKRQFRMTIEELKAKLHDTMVNRESVLELRQKESTTQANKMLTLESTIHELQHKLKVEEQALAETSKKADGYSRENYVSETTINQIRLILAESERRRGKPYFESDPAGTQNPAMLVHTMERCMQDMLKDVDVKKLRVEELDKEVGELKQAMSCDQQNLSTEYHQSEDETLALCKRITQMTGDHEKQMQQANERASNARKQAAALQSQLSMIQGQHEQQMKLKEDTITGIEAKVKHLREELQQERDLWQGKREVFEQTLGGTEKEMAKMRSERDEAVRAHASIESRVTDLQLQANKLNRDIDSEKESSSKFWEREGQMRSRQSELETRLEEKTRDVDRLEKMLSSVKQECSATVSEKVSMIERQERERHLDKISSLTAQLSEVSEKCNKSALELDNTRVENRDIHQQIRETTDRLETTKVQYEAATAERKHLADMLTAKTSDFERISQERDYYFNMIDQKNDELSQLKSQKDRLTIQLEEKDKNVQILQQQATNCQQMVESTSRSNESMREERDAYATQLQETTIALEDMKSSRDTMAKKMKIREKRIRETEGELKRVSEENDLRTQELEIVQQEKETLYKELKDSRYEVATLTEDRDGLKKESEGRKYQLERTVGKLQYRLKNAEQDLTLTQKALRKRESVDNSAVKVADKMQKEVTAKRSHVDTLQSRVRYLDDNIDTLQKEKHSVEGDKERLKVSLNKTLIQNQALATELDVANNRSLELKSHCNKLEQALEQLITDQKKDATVRNASSHAQVELFEQEMARMKLNHHIEVKEAVQKVTSQQNQEKYQSLTGQPSHRFHALSGQPSLPPAVMEPAPSRMKPEHTAQKDRLQAQKSSETYKEIGSELKHLLHEMRQLIGDKEQTIKDESRDRGRESRPHSKPGLWPRPHSPELDRRRAFTHYKVPQTPSDASYYSDPEMDDRIGERLGTLSGNYALYPPEKKREPRSRFTRAKPKHRRSHSAEASYLLPKEVSFAADRDPRNVSPSDISEECPSIQDKIPDTHELCRRLEEKIACLTKMGGNLQKENREMADLMKTQGKKLRKVKETEKRIRKTAR